MVGIARWSPIPVWCDMADDTTCGIREVVTKGSVLPKRPCPVAPSIFDSGPRPSPIRHGRRGGRCRRRSQRGRNSCSWRSGDHSIFADKKLDIFATGLLKQRMLAATQVEQAYQEIRRRILILEIRPEERLKEEEWAG